MNTEEKKTQEKMVSIEFGALSKPLKEQLADQGIALPEKDEEFLRRLMESITLLKLHGLVPYSVANRARSKVMKKIMKAIDEHGIPLEEKP